MVARSVCVFCGARSGLQPVFEEEARAVGQMLADHHWRLVYGAGDIGLMGAVANAAQAAGGKTFGVIPEHLMQTEIGKADVGNDVILCGILDRLVNRVLVFLDETPVIAEVR